MTSKEQAEELQAKAASLYHTEGMSVRCSINEAIPLTELLEIAKAANRLHEGSPYSGDWVALYADFVKALSALRATGKVKL